MAKDLAKSFIVSVLPVPAGPDTAPPEKQIFNQDLTTSVFNETQTLSVAHKLGHKREDSHA
jgi:hypothetical protein